MKRIFNPKIIFTSSFVIALLVLVILRSNDWRLPLPSWVTQAISPMPTTPEDAIYGMLDAARAGDAKTYLDSFSGPMRDQLLQIIKENTQSDFSAYLKSQNAAFQGVALSAAGQPSDSEAQVRVEYVYSNRNEVQQVYLRKESSRWKIFKVAGSEQVNTLIPFGSTVTD